MHAVKARELSRGICLLWKEAQHVALVEYLDFFIEVFMLDDEKRYVWHFFGVYASTDDKQRNAQWLTLQARISRCPEACLVIGDFNDILYNSENQVGNFRTERSMHDFWSFVADSQLLDLGFVGYPFTWRNRRHEGGIQEPLDKGLWSTLWLHHYPEATVSNQVVEGSDHSMLNLSRKLNCLDYLISCALPDLIHLSCLLIINCSHLFTLSRGHF